MIARHEIYEVYKIYDIAREYGSAWFQELAPLFKSASAPAWYEIHAIYEIHAQNVSQDLKSTTLMIVHHDKYIK